MSEKNESIKIYSCNICTKTYSSHSSLCNHNKKFHTSGTNQKQPLNDPKINAIQPPNDQKLICLYCNKKFNHYNNKWRHQKNCKIKEENNVITLIKNKELDIEKIKEEKELIKLKIEFHKSKKKDTLNNFKSINNAMKNNNFTINNNINNIVNNNVNLVSIGNENLVDALTYKEKKQIMNSKLCSLEKLIEIAHCGNYNKFKNIIITNLKDNLAYKYDDSKGYFITATKNELLNDFITNRIFDIEAIYDELAEANKIDDSTKKLIQKFLDQIQSDEPYLNEEEDIKYSNYKSYKINKIKILLYNNLDKITKDIALVISNE
jgi:hypothetical protein